MKMLIASSHSLPGLQRIATSMNGCERSQVKDGLRSIGFEKREGEGAQTSPENVGIY